MSLIRKFDWQATSVDNDNVDMERTHYKVGANWNKIGAGMKPEMSDRNRTSDQCRNVAETDTK